MSRIYIFLVIIWKPKEIRSMKLSCSEYIPHKKQFLCSKGALFTKILYYFSINIF